MEENMTATEMQRFLNQQYSEGKTEMEAYRNLMTILGIEYPQQKTEKISDANSTLTRED